MRRSVPYIAAFIFSLPQMFASAHADTSDSPGNSAAAALHAALSDPRRPIEQIELDTARKPAQLLAFAGLRAGDSAADFMPGNGYFTRILHRIDPAQLRREIESAGFVFEAQSATLRNPNDDHTLSVFDPRVRGRTDQFVYRFRKPR